MENWTLVTGGAGFVGSHLVELLLAQGRSVVVVDNLSTGRFANLEHLVGPRLRFIHQRVIDALASSPKLLDGVSEVYHLAALVGVKRVLDDTIEMVRTNVEETTALLDAVARASPRIRVLIASSSEVYGKTPKVPITEGDDSVLGPTTSTRWSYALSKALDEHLALSLHRAERLDAVIVRLFNTIGPRQMGNYGMVVPRFVEAAVARQELVIYGDGRQTRCFCDVRDVVHGMIDLMATASCYGRVFNIGSDREISISDLADRVIRAAGERHAAKRFVSYTAVYGVAFEEPIRRVPNLQAIRDAIGFEQRYTLEDTLAELVERERAGGVEPVLAKKAV